MYPQIYERYNFRAAVYPHVLNFHPTVAISSAISAIQTIQIIHPLQHNSITHETTLRVAIHLHRSIVLTSNEKKSSETKHVLHYHSLLKLST